MSATKPTLESLLAGMHQQADADYAGEPVSQLEHALQAAHHAALAGGSEVQVLAALLHDVGHWCVPGAKPMAVLGAQYHEQLGEDHVRSLGLAEDIADLVGMHVDAKRFLVASNTRYAEKLSPASRETLHFQGGPMSGEEAARFAVHRLSDDALKLRAWDEAAKNPSADVPGLEHYRQMLCRNLVLPLTETQIAQWCAEGFLHLPGWYNAAEMVRIRNVTDALQDWPETPGRWMKYFEPGSKLCRVENFLDYEPIFSGLVRGQSALRLLSQLMAEPAVLFKEKINFKLAGGQGFVAHQDAPAFTQFGQEYHITMMLSIDATSTANGCLEISPGGGHGGLLPVNDDLTLTAAEQSRLRWEPIETEPGDIVLFDSLLPHRSAANNTASSRRVLYATYNRLRDGDVRSAYFDEKRQAFPPDVEREAGKTYDSSGVFNVGNPVN
jgi:2-aminoethylphosphonate dioxygenase